MADKSKSTYDRNFDRGVEGKDAHEPHAIAFDSKQRDNNADAKRGNEDGKAFRDNVRKAQKN